MILPNVDLVIVEKEKILGYLLNPSHRHGSSKARFFFEFGFEIPKWETQAEALREHGGLHPVCHREETGFGPRYVVDDVLRTPSGRAPMLRTVWQMDAGALAPRLITAHPLEDSI